MMAATTTLLDLPEVDDDRPDDDCATCGTVHSADLHGAVLDLRSWLRHDLQRRLVALPRDQEPIPAHPDQTAATCAAVGVPIWPTPSPCSVMAIVSVILLSNTFAATSFGSGDAAAVRQVALRSAGTGAAGRISAPTSSARKRRYHSAGTALKSSAMSFRTVCRSALG